MEIWPTDARGIANSSRKEGKNKQNAYYPHLNLGHGLVAALTLQDRGDQLGWTSVVKEYDTRHARLNASKSVNVFPSTRSLAVRTPQISNAQKGEQGANFLRKHFPDVDVTAELMREEIESDAKVTAELQEFNPYHGNPITHLQTLSRQYLAFSMGETGGDLNISSFRGSTLKACAKPVKTFPTPITQIVAESASDGNNTTLAVRTFSTTSVLKLWNDDPHLPAQVEEINTISSADVGRREIVDIHLPSSDEAIVINDQGMAYIYDRASTVFSRIFNYADLDSTSEVLADDFWRAAGTGMPSKYLLTSGKTARLIDSRGETDFVELFSVHRPADYVTALESQDGHLIRLCTTAHLLWIDVRYPGRPLLGISHERRYDRTLGTQTLHLNEGPLTFLTSLKNGVVNVYDVSRADEDSLLHANHQPYNLTSRTESSQAILGQTFVSYLSEDTIGFFRLQEDGSVHRIDCGFSREEDDFLSNLVWPDDVKAMNESAPSLRRDLGPLGAREYMEEDLSAAYARIHQGVLNKLDVRVTNVIYDLAENASSFWQEANMPLEHVLTFFDVIFRAGDEPETSYRSDFLTGSVMSSTKGYQALQQKRLTANALANGTKWHWNLKDTLRALDPTYAGDIDEIYNRLAGYDLQDTALSDSDSSVRWEDKAREQVAVDLAMSGHVYSLLPLKRSDPIPDDLETMTKALTIDAEPPPVHFHYLLPVPRSRAPKRRVDLTQDSEEEDEVLEVDEEPEELDLPLGVRLLLKDWDVGSDPGLFAYIDPYTDAKEDAAAIVPINKPKIQAVPQVAVVRPQAPPAIARASSLRNLTHQNLFFGSQPNLRDLSSQQTPIPQGSQAPVVSTQVLPGPHGGRPIVPKKKPVKKRLGGF